MHVFPGDRSCLTFEATCAGPGRSRGFPCIKQATTTTNKKTAVVVSWGNQTFLFFFFFFG